MKSYNFNESKEEMKKALSEDEKGFESIKEEDETKKAQDAIKGVIEKDWGGSNKDQYAAVQLLSGLASNNSDEANTFMDDLNKLTDKMDLKKYGIGE